MVNNTMITQNGVKVINNRAFKTIPDYSIPNRFRVSINTPDVAYSDTDLTTTIPITVPELIDSCYDASSWTTTGCSVTSNTGTYKPDSGTAGALNIVKTGTAVANCVVNKTTTSIDGTNKDFAAWVYVSTGTALAKLSTGTGSSSALEFRYGSDAGNFAYEQILSSELSTGWNYVKNSITGGFTGVSGSPVVSALDYSYLRVTTINSTTTIDAGEIIFDALTASSADDYYKAVDSVTINETDGSVTTVSKLTVSEANGFLIDVKILSTITWYLLSI